MKKLNSILVFILFMNLLYAQKEDHIWYFGPTGAGLDFNTCPPTVLTNGINDGFAFEGSVCISEGLTGQLLFYSNGYNVYNANHALMLNGLSAGLSSSITQNAIVRKPGSNNIYYLFTADVQGGLSYNINYPNAFGVNYAVIDMSLVGGLGSVVSKFNSLKDTSNCEKLTTVRHSNGQDIWLIGHEYRNNNFFVFQINSVGIDTIPNLFSVGPTIYTYQIGIPGNSRFDAIGELKASTDGSKVAFTTFYNGTTALFDFDNSSGAISNPITLNINRGGYGLSFSPDNSKLYIAAIDTSTIIGSPNNGQIIQFDISSGNQTIIQNSKTVIYTCSNCGFGSMKIAPDRKIYVARYGGQGNWAGDSSLGVINYPDSLGMSCLYVHNGMYLNGLRGSWSLNNAMENINYCNPLAISENEKDYTHIYPNPMGLELNIDFAIPINLKKTFELVDMYGEKVLSGQLTTKNNRIDVSKLSSGAYFINVIVNDKMITRKVLKQ